jgi:hypothetical protein
MIDSASALRFNPLVGERSRSIASPILKEEIVCSQENREQIEREFTGTVKSQRLEYSCLTTKSRRRRKNVKWGKRVAFTKLKEA